MKPEEYFRYDYAATGSSGARVPFYGLVEPTLRLACTVSDAIFAAYRYLDKAVAAVWRRVLIERTVKELSGLDDHLLKDIGIERGQIRHLAEAVAHNPRFSVRDLPR